MSAVEAGMMSDGDPSGGGGGGGGGGVDLLGVNSVVEAISQMSEYHDIDSFNSYETTSYAKDYTRQWEFKRVVGDSSWVCNTYDSQGLILKLQTARIVINVDIRGTPTNSQDMGGPYALEKATNSSLFHEGDFCLAPRETVAVTLAGSKTYTIDTSGSTEDLTINVGDAAFGATATLGTVNKQKVVLDTRQFFEKCSLRLNSYDMLPTQIFNYPDRIKLHQMFCSRQYNTSFMENRGFVLDRYEHADGETKDASWTTSEHCWRVRDQFSKLNDSTKTTQEIIVPFDHEVIQFTSNRPYMGLMLRCEVTVNDVWKSLLRSKVSSAVTQRDKAAYTINNMYLHIDYISNTPSVLLTAGVAQDPAIFLTSIFNTGFEAKIFTFPWEFHQLYALTSGASLPVALATVIQPTQHVRKLLIFSTREPADNATIKMGTVNRLVYDGLRAVDDVKIQVADLQQNIGRIDWDTGFGVTENYNRYQQMITVGHPQMAVREEPLDLPTCRRLERIIFSNLNDNKPLTVNFRESQMTQPMISISLRVTKFYNSTGTSPTVPSDVKLWIAAATNQGYTVQVLPHTSISATTATITPFSQFPIFNAGIAATGVNPPFSQVGVQSVGLPGAAR